jgi:excisionase family DNA binding protein
MTSATVRGDLLDMAADDFPRWYQETLESSAGTDSGASTERRRRSRHGRATTPALSTSPKSSWPSGSRLDPESHLEVDLRGATLPTATEAQDAAATAAPPLLLTIEQAAERLTIGRCTMQQLLLDGEVRSFKIGKLRRIPPEALDEYIARKMRP